VDFDSETVSWKLCTHSSYDLIDKIESITYRTCCAEAASSQVDIADWRKTPSWGWYSIGM